jgi:hypothetical protein
MNDFVCYIPSYNDSELVAESVNSSPDWDIVISDNASDEPHRSWLAAMAGPRVQVIRQAKSLGRVGNWRFCVEHFLTSEKQWLKLLCAGDRHRPDALRILSRAVEKYPQIRFIVSDVEVIWADRSGRYSPMGQEVIVPPVHAMAATVEFGNIYFGLLAILVHRDALTAGFDFGGRCCISSPTCSFAWRSPNELQLSSGPNRRANSWRFTERPCRSESDRWTACSRTDWCDCTPLPPFAHLGEASQTIKRC